MQEQKNKAVFLDRDGVLCEDTDYISSFKKFHIFEFAREAVELIHKKGYLAIVITNQSGIARGYFKEEMLINLNQHLKEVTGVDEVYYCPHLPPDKEEIPPYLIHCQCRKPHTGMIQKAAEDYQIDLSQSYMAGDRQSDIQTGKNAGLKTVFISGRENQLSSDYVCDTVLEFVKNYLE